MVRPFSESAKVHCRGYSTPLQQVITDFGADVSFDEASKKILMHYGLDLPASSIRSIVENHAGKVEKNLGNIQQRTPSKRCADLIIAEIDGSMIPLVEFDDKHSGDRRKTRKTLWGENRLSLAYEKGYSTKPMYGTTMGNAHEAGTQLENAVNLVGQGKETRLHCVSDGALWIAEQVEERFGANAKFIIDFYHLSEYLHAAAQCCNPSDKLKWTDTQKQCMRENKIDNVLHELEKHINEVAGSGDDHVCDAYKCHRYMTSRLNQFDYKNAIENNPPIGSGKIEGGHRSVIQKRLKLSGGWWLRKNASAMSSLRVLRANGYWNNYWSQYSMTET